MAVMFIILLFINKIDYNRKRKQLKVSNVKRNWLANNKTLIINRKSITAPSCDNGEIPEDSADCENSYDTLLEKTTAEAWGTGDGIEEAVNIFIAECGTTACDPDCNDVIAGATIGDTVDTDLHTGLISSCEPARISKTASCNEPPSDTAECAKAFLGAKSSGFAPTWKGKDVRDAINNFIDKCPTTACQNDCSSLIMDQNFRTEPTDFNTAFPASCIIPKSSIAATCVTTETDTAQCVPAYNNVISASEATSWGDGIDVIVAVNDFITNCKKRLCVEECRSLVNNKPLGTSIANFKTTFQDKCKAVVPPPPSSEGGEESEDKGGEESGDKGGEESGDKSGEESGDKGGEEGGKEEKSDGIKSARIYILLIAMSVASASIHLIL
jgi:hypothetical protein